MRPGDGCCAWAFVAATVRHVQVAVCIALPRVCCIAALRPDQPAPAPRSRPPIPPSPCASYFQMMAKAYVGEDLVCEAELTLVMQPEK